MNLLRQTIVDAIDPALALLPPALTSDNARVMMLAIGLQESELIHRYQVLSGGGRGPARGLAQFEDGGGVKGVMTHASSRDLARELCEARGTAWDRRTIWQRLEFDDVLAMGFARLLLLTDPAPLPGPDAHPDISWAYYERNWRPGKPHPRKWPGNWQAACVEVFS